MDQFLYYLGYFKDSSEFGWTEKEKNGKESYKIYAKAVGTENTACSYPCGLTDGKINNTFFFKN